MRRILGERLEALRRAVLEGRYRPDARRIADRLVVEMRSLRPRLRSRRKPD